MASQGVLSNGTTTNKPLIDQLRGSMKTQLNANVHGQIRDYKVLLKRVSGDFKVLSKKCDAYGKSEASLNKVNVQKTKAEQSGAPETKQLKMQSAYQVKNTAYEVCVCDGCANCTNTRTSMLRRLPSRPTWARHPRSSRTVSC